MNFSSDGKFFCSQWLSYLLKLCSALSCLLFQFVVVKHFEASSPKIFSVEKRNNQPEVLRSAKIILNLHHNDVVKVKGCGWV
jgi:hypothetical protein